MNTGWTEPTLSAYAARLVSGSRWRDRTVQAAAERAGRTDAIGDVVDRGRAKIDSDYARGVASWER